MSIEVREKRDDKRKFERVNFREAVEYQLREPFNTGGCLAYDLSEGGIKINLNDFIPVSTEIEVRMRMGNNPKPINLMGRVAWVSQVPYSDRYQVGLEFDQAASDAITEFKKEVHRYIQSRRF